MSNPEVLKFEPTHGPIIGEATETDVIVWYRDEKGETQTPIFKYWSKADKSDLRQEEIEVDSFIDYTSKTQLAKLTPATQYYFEIGDKTGSFKTTGSKSCTFVFGSCIGGQGFGRYTSDHPDGEGFPIFNAMSKLKPDFVQIQGDFIYADNAIEKESTGMFNKGQTYITPGGVSVLPIADSMESFRARYKYNLEDKALGDFLRNTIVFNTWDDHEIYDDFGKDRLSKQGESNLFTHGEAVFHEYWPLAGPEDDPGRIYRSMNWGPHVEMFVLDTRSYRATHEDNDNDPTTTPTMKHILGEKQKNWLLDGLGKSTRTWKFIATSVPLAYPTGWPRPEETGYDGWSDGNSDKISGPEIELLEIFRFIKDHNIQNVVFLSGDVHFPFCISYDPFEDGEPLAYEIGATPFHSLCLPPPERGPDESFHPNVLFAAGKFADQSFLNFGHVEIDDDASFTFNIRDKNGASMYQLDLKPNLWVRCEVVVL